MAMATKACSPPDRAARFLMTLPGGCTRISMPQPSGSAWSIQQQLGPAAAEQFGKDLPEVAADLPEALQEELAHLGCELLDEPSQLPTGLFHIVQLSRQEAVPLRDLLAFLHSAHIDAAKTPDAAAYQAQPVLGLLRGPSGAETCSTAMVGVSS